MQSWNGTKKTENKMERVENQQIPNIDETCEEIENEIGVLKGDITGEGF